MEKKYNVSFTADEKQAFALMPSFGVPVRSLKSILNMKKEELLKSKQPGIPADSANNELADWVLNTRLSNPKVRIAIKGDNDADVPTVQKVMKTLQDKKVNKFNLITDMENKPSI
jgi:biopolymer transport protein ExbD